MNHISPSPFFSIIVPVYQNEKLLNICLDSIKAQTMCNWECICINDGSTDHCSTILDHYASQDERFRIIHKHNEGVSVARNLGISKANAPYIMFVDADDHITPQTLQTCYETITATPCDMIVFGANWIARNHSHVDYISPTIKSIPPDAILHVQSNILFTEKNGIPACWAKIYKKEILEKNKIKFPLNVKFAEDIYFTTQYFCFCNSITIINIPFYQYSTNEETGITCHAFSDRLTLDDQIHSLQTVISLHTCLKNNSQYSKNIFIKGRNLFCLFKLSYFNYYFIFSNIIKQKKHSRRDIQEIPPFQLTHFITFTNSHKIFLFLLKTKTISLIKKYKNRFGGN